jgi:hypothetical protein
MGMLVHQKLKYIVRYKIRCHVIAVADPTVASIAVKHGKTMAKAEKLES